jgi:hypothetical protein
MRLQRTRHRRQGEARPSRGRRERGDDVEDFHREIEEGLTRFDSPARASGPFDPAFEHKTAPALIPAWLRHAKSRVEIPLNSRPHSPASHFLIGEQESALGGLGDPVWNLRHGLRQKLLTWLEARGGRNLATDSNSTRSTKGHTQLQTMRHAHHVAVLEELIAHVETQFAGADLIPRVTCWQGHGDTVRDVLRPTTSSIPQQDDARHVARNIPRKAMKALASVGSRCRKLPARRSGRRGA